MSIKNKAFVFHFLLAILLPFIASGFMCFFTKNISIEYLFVCFLYTICGLKMYFFSLVLYLLPVGIKKLLLFYIVGILVWIYTSYFLFKIEIKGHIIIARIMALSFIIINILSGLILVSISSL